MHGPGWQLRECLPTRLTFLWGNDMYIALAEGRVPPPKSPLATGLLAGADPLLIMQRMATGRTLLLHVVYLQGFLSSLADSTPDTTKSGLHTLSCAFAGSSLKPSRLCP